MNRLKLRVHRVDHKCIDTDGYWTELGMIVTNTSSTMRKVLRLQAWMATVPKSRRGRQERKGLKDWRTCYE